MGETFDDSAFWVAASVGDARAFAALFDRHRDAVHRVAWRLVGDATDAEDVTAITFLELWRLRGRVQVVSGSIRPWLLVTAIHSAQNFSRSKRRYARLLASLPGPELDVDPGETVSARDTLAEQRRAITVELGKLRTIDQQLLFLVDVEELSIHQASEHLGLGYGAAKTRLSRARARLRLQLSSQTGLTSKGDPVT